MQAVVVVLTIAELLVQVDLVVVEQAAITLLEQLVQSTPVVVVAVVAVDLEVLL